jgi:hypothetical protein
MLLHRIANLAPDIAITIHGAAALRARDFTL